MKNIETQKTEITSLQKEIVAYLKSGTPLDLAECGKIADLLEKYLQKIETLVFAMERGRVTQEQTKILDELKSSSQKVREGKSVQNNVMMFLQVSVQLYLDKVKKKSEPSSMVAG